MEINTMNILTKKKFNLKNLSVLLALDISMYKVEVWTFNCERYL